MLLFAYDYKGNKTEFTVDEEFDYLKVDIITGDEVIEVFKNGAPGEPPTCIAYCDSSEDRMEEFHDYEYFVPRRNVIEWMTRTDAGAVFGFDWM